MTSESLSRLSAVELKRKLDDNAAVLVDIREENEFAREHIPGAQHNPISSFNAAKVPASSGKTVVFCCQGGRRTASNEAQLAGCAKGGAAMLEGGLEAWRAAGLPTVLDRSKPIDIMRQVQIAAGSMVIAGLLLTLLSPWFLALTAFAGAGLVFSGVTGTCGMARLLMHMPWNRQ